MILAAVVYFRNLALLVAWDLVTTYRANGSKMVYLTLLWSHTHSIFINNPSCYLVYFRNFTLLGVWNVVTTFRAIGQKMVYLALFWGHTLVNFLKQPLI